MHHFLLRTNFILTMLWFSACTSNTNKSAEDAADGAVAQYANRPARNIVSAAEFIELAACDDLPCVQVFMKNFSADFIHARPGEFASLNRFMVTDTLGDSLDIPISTVYVSVDPGADWRMAHTVHHKTLSDQLLQEFSDQKFVLSDSLYNKKSNRYTYHYRSEQYPGLVLSHLTTFAPWHKRGLYYTVTWPCYVFELNAVE